MLIWFLNDNLEDGLNVANDVNVIVNYANNVNGASNLNTASYEKKLLINQFQTWSIGQMLNWSGIFSPYL